MAQPQSSGTGEYDRPTPSTPSSTTPNQPGQVEGLNRPARNVRTAIVAAAALLFLALVIVAMVFLG